MTSADKIKQYLYEWFLENDNLIVPDLGKFEANYLGATIQPGIHKFLPPNKIITFNPLIRQDDGVFASYIAQNIALSPHDAQHLIRDFVLNLKNELELKRKYKIDSFGTFMLMPDQSISFQTEEDVNYLGESFGLSSLYSKPSLHLETETDETLSEFSQPNYANTSSNELIDSDISKNIDTQQDDDDIVLEEEVVDSTGRRWIMALVVMVIAVSTLFAFFLITDTNPFGSSGELSNKESSEDTTHIKGEELNRPNEEEDKTEKNTESKKEDSKKENPPKRENKNKPEVKTPKITYATDNSYIGSFAFNPNPPANLSAILVKEQASRYFVILGSFDKVTNAYSFHNNLTSRGVSTAKILAPSASNPKYRIALSDYSSEKDALREGNAFGSRNRLGYWIFNY